MSDSANATWSATALAQDDATIRGSALSVRQRKLLAALNTPMSVDALSSMSGIPHAEVEANLSRFEKLGLAFNSAAAATAPAALRPSTFATASTASPTSSTTGSYAGSSSSKMPLIIGGVALTAIAAAIWMFTGSSKPAPAPSAPP
ncbi:MAG: hypothetical protein ACRDAM_15550, partial [Casimicrobium sp.]